MEKLLQPGRLIFATGIIALGIYQLIIRDYIVGRPPAELNPYKPWVYISSAIFILSAVFIWIRLKPGHAAFVIGLMILVYSFLARHLPAMIDSSWEGILWSLNAYKTLALAGGAFIISASFFAEEGRGLSNVFTNERLIVTGYVLLALFLVIAGLSHFKYNDFVRVFIPEYIPLRPFWSYFTGIALLAGGVGLLINRTRKWAAFLSGLMILLWFFLLHIPRTVADPQVGEWLGVFESFTFSGMLFVLAAISVADDGAPTVTRSGKI